MTICIVWPTVTFDSIRCEEATSMQCEVVKSGTLYLMELADAKMPPKCWRVRLQCRRVVSDENNNRLFQGKGEIQVTWWRNMENSSGWTAAMCSQVQLLLRQPCFGQPLVCNKDCFLCAFGSNNIKFSFSKAIKHITPKLLYQAEFYIRVKRWLEGFFILFKTGKITHGLPLLA